MLNKVMLMGRLTANAELKRTMSGKDVASFTLAVNRDFKGQNGEREADFIHCVAWGNTAEFISKYFSQGSMAVIVGRLQTRRWETDNGDKRTATEVIVENAYFGESKRENTATESNVGTDNGFSGFMPIDADPEDIPF